MRVLNMARGDGQRSPRIMMPNEEGRWFVHVEQLSGTVPCAGFLNVDLHSIRMRLTDNPQDPFDAGIIA